MSMYDLPYGLEKGMHFFMNRLFWQEDEDVKKYHLVSWDKVGRPKDKGGWG